MRMGFFADFLFVFIINMNSFQVVKGRINFKE